MISKSPPPFSVHTFIAISHSNSYAGKNWKSAQAQMPKPATCNGVDYAGKNSENALFAWLIKNARSTK